MQTLSLLLALFVAWSGATAKVYLRSGECPRGKWACTLPADALLEGPGGSAVIVIPPKLLRETPRFQARVLAHEVGHVVYDLDLLREGRRVECARADRMAEDFVRRLEGR